MIRHIIFWCFLCFITQANAANTSNEEKSFFDELNWQVMLDVGLIKGSSIIVGSEEENIGDWMDITLLLDLSYKRFFIMSDRRRFSHHGLGLQTGFQLLTKDKWQLDIINKNYIAGFNERNVGTVFMEDIKELKGVNDREHLSSTGLRFSHTDKETQFLVDIVTNSETHGFIIDTYYSQVHPYRNWDIYLGAGVSIYSHQVNSYYYGVKANEANENRPVYTLGSGYRLQLEANAQYPLSESWLFNAGISLNQYSKNIADSPLTRGQYLIQSLISVRYVF